MTTYFVASGGSNTSPYDTWAKAATSLQTALTAATVAGDMVVIQYDGVPTGDKEVSADTTWTIPASINIVSSTNSGTATITPTAMGTTGWLGNSTSSFNIAMNGSAAVITVYTYGLTFRIASTSNRNITLNSIATGTSTFLMDNCYLWLGTTGSGSVLHFAGTGGTSSYTTHLRNSTVRFGHTGQKIRNTNGRILMENVTISASGSAPTTVFDLSAGPSSSIVCSGCDLSVAGSGTLVGNVNVARTVTFANCKIGSGAVPMATQTTVTNRSGAEVFVINCDSGGTNYRHEHWNPFGSQVVETTIVRTGGATDGTTPISWKIVTTSISTWTEPFICLPATIWNDTTASNVTVTVYGYWDNAAVPKNDDIWMEVSYMGASTSPLATINVANTKTDIIATNADQGTDSSTWGGGDTTTRFKMAVTLSSPQPAQKGPIYVTVKAAKASSTFYIDPKIVLS